MNKSENSHKLWVDQYRPKSLDDYTYNLEAANTFKQLAQSSTDIPHLIVEGIGGIGKKSMVMSFIKECLNNYGLKGDEIYKTSNMEISLKYPNKKILLNIQKSLYHYNLNPSDYGIYDRHIVQDFLKSQFRYKCLTGFPYKNVIIRSAENLSIDAQQSLRRTLENCIKNCRFIFMVDTENQGTLIPALNSRCIRIRMSAPNKNQARDVIDRILEQEGVKINPTLIQAIFRKNGRNLTHTINLLQLLTNIRSPQELLRLTNVNLQDICPITLCCNQIVTEMFTSDNINMIVRIRTRIYTLLTHGVNPEEIIKRIFKIAINNLPGLELEIIELTNEVEFRLTKSSREFYHIENYIVKLLVLIKQFQIDPKKYKALANKLPKLPPPIEEDNQISNQINNQIKRDDQIERDNQIKRDNKMEEVDEEMGEMGDNNESINLLKKDQEMSEKSPRSITFKSRKKVQIIFKKRK